MDTEKLLYRRQFIFAPKEIDDFPTWKKYNILDKYMLYAHPDLVQSEYSEGNKRLILLGDLYDPENYEFNNMNILARLIKNNSITELIESSFKYAGRFALFFIYSNSIYVFHDSNAARRVYYTTKNNAGWCGSMPSVLAKFAGLAKTTDKIVLDYYNSNSFTENSNADIYNTTIYKDIEQLTANFYFDFQQYKAIRYWPNKPIKQSSLTEGVEIGSKLLQGILKSANFRYDLMLPVTAGFDSRLLLSATKDISSDLFYYIIKHSSTSNSYHDIKIPSKLFAKINLNFNIIEYPKEVDPEFKKLYFLNDEFAIENDISVIYNVFYKRFSDKINLPANFSTVARNFNTTFKNKITAELLSEMNNLNNEHVLNVYRNWILEITDVVNKYGYSILDLFEWEEGSGNSITKTQTNKDISQEEFIPFNCRNLMITYLSVPKKYRNIYTNIYYKAMIKYMWPELLSVPFNPHLWKHYYATKLKLYWILRWVKKGW